MRFGQIIDCWTHYLFIFTLVLLFQCFLLLFGHRLSSQAKHFSPLMMFFYAVLQLALLLFLFIHSFGHKPTQFSIQHENCSIYIHYKSCDFRCWLVLHKFLCCMPFNACNIFSSSEGKWRILSFKNTFGTDIDGRQKNIVKNYIFNLNKTIINVSMGFYQYHDIILGFSSLFSKTVKSGLSHPLWSYFRGKYFR